MTDSASQPSDFIILSGGKINSKLYMYYSRRNPRDSVNALLAGKLSNAPKKRLTSELIGRNAKLRLQNKTRFECKRKVFSAIRANSQPIWKQSGNIDHRKPRDVRLISEEFKIKETPYF